MTNENGVVRAISWRDLCPWTILFRVFRLSLSVQLLSLAFIAVWMTSLGWQAAGRVILSAESGADASIDQFLANVSGWPEAEFSLRPPVVAALPVPATSKAGTDDDESARAAAGDTTLLPRRPWAAAWEFLGKTPMYALVEPFRRLFDPRTSWNQWLFFLCGGTWSLLVWSWVGGAITRTAVVRLGRDERVGLRDSLEFAQRKLLSFLGAPLLPLTAIVALSVPLFLLGLLMRTSLGVALAGLFWLPAALLGFVIALFAVGVFFGWPLMGSAICAEGSDAFDGISRSYAYTFQRPLHYLAYALIAATLGYLGWIVVGIFCEAVVQFAMWGIAGGSGHQRLSELRDALANDKASSLVSFGATLIGWVNRCVLGVEVAYTYSYMWAANAAIYLLLRRDADQTELDDVFVEEEDGVTYGLPALKLDEAGVPGAEDAAEDVVPADSRGNE